MKNKNYYCIIMAGGIGVRFWPISKAATPKQFIDILGDGSTLIQKTYRRFAEICPDENIYVVTNTQYKELVKEQLPNIGDEQIVLEPSRRNTAPCIAYANHKIKAKNKDAVIVVAPSDHIIMNEPNFIEVISNGLAVTAKQDCLLTIGIRPSYPNTGYGYIQFDEEKVNKDNASIYDVKTFTEKPVREMAERFIESGDFLWNSGIFMWSLASIEKAFKEFLPEVNELFESGNGLYNTAAETDFIKNVYGVCKNISIDYGIMEKARNVHVYAANFGWSDLGTWGALYEIREKDENRNTIVGKRVKVYETNNCIVNVKPYKVTVLQGLDDYIVVDTDDVLMVCKKDEEQQIRQYVNDVAMDFGDEYC